MSCDLNKDWLSHDMEDVAERRQAALSDLGRGMGWVDSDFGEMVEAIGELFAHAEQLVPNSSGDSQHGRDARRGLDEQRYALAMPKAARDSKSSEFSVYMKYGGNAYLLLRIEHDFRRDPLELQTEEHNKKPIVAALPTVRHELLAFLDSWINQVKYDSFPHYQL